MTRWDARACVRWGLVAASGVLVLGGCAGVDEVPDEATLVDAVRSASPAGSSVGDEAGDEAGDAAVTEACEAVVPRGFSEIGQSADPTGVTSIWGKGARSVACDVVGEDAPVVVDTARPGRGGFDARTLSVLTRTLSGHDSPAVRLLAAGRLPWPVDELAYSLPDGHTEQARFVTDARTGETWWVMAYTVEDGPLVHPGDVDDPVTVAVTGAAAEAFRFPWRDLQRSE